jgi:GntR family transcriptional regulator, transcriptional repressor for pyruvate dehydrogenase complex
VNSAGKDQDDSMKNSGATAELFKSPKRESNVDLVLAKIKYLLLSKKLIPGSRLPSEMELANSLSVSRGTIREAMKILSAFGIVEIRRGDGTYIAESVSSNLFEPLLFNLILSQPDQKNLRELREVIEFGIVRMILKNADAEDLARIEAEFQDMQRKLQDGERDPHILTQCDLNFHIALGRATRNPLLEQIYTFVLEYFAPSIEKTHENETSGMIAFQTHQQILDALKAQNLQQATQAIEDSLQVWADLSV